MKPSIALLRLIPRLIFFSRWLQLSLYTGLVTAQVAYVYLFVVEVQHLISHPGNIDETKIMLAVLGLIDMVMISNLLIMVIIGGYDVFVSKLGIEDREDRPEWLGHVNVGMLKVKLSMVLISISSVYLLKTFIDMAQKDTHTILWQITVHVAFLVSVPVMARVDRIIPHAYLHSETADTH